MTAVIDASALAALVADLGDEGRWVLAAVGREPLAGPHLVLAEASNVLRRIERRGHISNAEADEAYRQLAEAAVSLYPFGPFAERIWELRHNLTAYDAWYVALAESLDCPLVTLDVRLSRSPGPGCAFIAPPSEDG